jgi:hypothetical protein
LTKSYVRILFGQVFIHSKIRLTIDPSFNSLRTLEPTVRPRKVVLFLLIGFLCASSAWAIPQEWGVFVPTGARYLSTRGGSIGFDWGWQDCNGYDRTGIDHFTWFGCIDLCIWCPGYMCTNDPAFDVWQVVGDYYDCDGNLLEAGSPLGWLWAIIRGTGTIFDGGIGGHDNWLPICTPTWCSPARDCRVYEDTEPQLSYCPYGLYPFIPPPVPE